MKQKDSIGEFIDWFVKNVWPNVLANMVGDFIKWALRVVFGTVLVWFIIAICGLNPEQFIEILIRFYLQFFLVQ